MNKQALLVAIICSIATIVSAQYYSYPAGRNGTTYHSGGNGSSAGRTTVNGNNAYHYNGNGYSAGRSQTIGNKTYHYDAQGRQTGSSMAY